MKLTIDAPDGLQVMFIGYVAHNDIGQLFASQHVATEDELNGRKDIVLCRGLEDDGNA